MSLSGDVTSAARFEFFIHSEQIETLYPATFSSPLKPEYMNLTPLTIALAATINLCLAQDKPDFRQMLENRRWTFQAQTMSPATGGIRQLSTGYVLTVHGDSLTCDLPYMGRVYQPTISSNSGLTFTSTKFTYENTVRKKGGWSVNIQTKDQSNSRRFIVTVFEDGNVSMNVNCTERQPVSYRGSLVSPKK